jgi:hypothetical protein
VIQTRTGPVTVDLKLFPNDATITYELVGKAGTVVSSIPASIHESVDLAVPFSSGTKYLIRVAISGMTVETSSGAHDLYQFDCVCTKASFSTVRAIFGKGVHTDFFTTPNVLDAVGDIYSPATTLVFSDRVDRLWQLLRMYQNYCSTNGSPSILEALRATVQRMGLNDPETFDQRVLDMDWWLSDATTRQVGKSEKKRLYRQFFELIQDYVVMATTDSGFASYLSTEWN